MTTLDASAIHPGYLITPQHMHRLAAQQHENAQRHHKEAAALHAMGDKRQAASHANLAYQHAVAALATSVQTCVRL